MSGSGAKVAFNESSRSAVDDVAHLPDRLTLVLRADHMQVDCSVMWRRSGKMGLRFLGAPRVIPKSSR